MRKGSVVDTLLAPFRAAAWLVRLVVWTALAIVFLPIGWVLSSWKRVAVLAVVALVAVRMLWPSALPAAAGTLSRTAADVLTWIENVAAEHERQRRQAPPPPPSVEPTRRPAQSLRLATFNLRDYGKPPKFGEPGQDVELLARTIHALDADIIAVQEVFDPVRLDEFAATRLRSEGRYYRFIWSACGGGGPQYLGFLYDARTVTLRERLEEPSPYGLSGITCKPKERPLFLATFDFAGQSIELVNVHFKAFGDRESVAERLHQIDELVRLVSSRPRGRAIAALGDFNSTGFLTDAYGERTYLLRALGSVGLNILGDLRCSAYWKPPEAINYAPNLLDHIAVSEAFPAARSASVRGYCARLDCAPAGWVPPSEYQSVSDHCPVVVEGP